MSRSSLIKLDISVQLELIELLPKSKYSKNPEKFCSPFMDLYAVN